MTSVHIPRRILSSVAKPARYAGGEWNSVNKQTAAEAAGAGGDYLVRFAFCFPDTYEIGMSNLALRILYDQLNQRPDTWCERFFAPWKDMEQLMRTEGLPLFSIESRTPLAEFDLIGFTLQYELACTNVLNMLDLGGVPVLAADRGLNDPLVLAGGPVAYNIEPMADFFDLAVIGEGEEVIAELVNLYRDCRRDCNLDSRRDGRPDREAFLLRAARLEGVYVPSFYDVSYHPDGTIADIRPNRPGVPEKIRKRIVRDLDSVRYPVKSLVPNTEIVHDRMFLEIFRGCPRGCRFCQAGMIYRPVREKQASTLIDQALAQESSTGYDEIGLLSLSTSDYSDLTRLTDGLLERLKPHRTSLSLPSLRLDSFSLELMEKAAQTRKSGLTFAPEAGTQRLRDVINKNITENDLLEAMNLAFRGGWNGAKLYFMLGLPTETSEDVLGIALLVQAVENLYRSLPKDLRPRRLELAVSTAVFIPKPFTPFQWCGQASGADLKEKIQLLRDKLRSRSIKYQWHDLASSRLEAVLARGDRRLGPVILDAWRRGRTFDAWDESFDDSVWLGCLAAAGLDPDFYTLRERPETEIFPWSLIDCGVSQAFLLDEYRKSLRGETTPQCRISCGNCGAQEFGAGICCGQQAAGADSQPVRTEPSGNSAGVGELVLAAPAYVLRLHFVRQEPAIWLAHLDLMRTFERAIRRAGLPVAYSQGFNPRPHLVFALPIGVGLAACDDLVDIYLTESVEAAVCMDKLNAALPEGLSIRSAEAADPSGPSPMSLVRAAEYELAGDGLAAAAARLAGLPANQPWLAEKNSKGQPVTIDIRPLLLDLEIIAADRLRVLVKAGSRENLRPDLLLSVMTALGGLDPSAARDTEVTRLRLVLEDAPVHGGKSGGPVPGDGN